MNARLKMRLLALGLLACAGCAPAPPDAVVLQRAFELAQQENWAQAKPIISEYLYAVPDDPGGHLLFGRWYLAQPVPMVTPAEGEFELALRLMERGAYPNALELVLPPEQLSIALHTELSRIKLILARMLQAGKAPDEGVLAQVNLAFETALTGRRAHPENVLMEKYFLEVRTFQHAYHDNPRLPIAIPPNYALAAASPATSRR